MKAKPNWKRILCITGVVALIVTGVLFMFFFSSLGGFGGASTVSWWWAPLIPPYPAGWMLAITVLIMREVKNHNNTRQPGYRAG